ncbi:MAG: hypothetical protein IH609_10420, partial [Dehalococcoidia bacterium]|nr:hypothetical protein [Dehalococcoidia bacterium]
MSKEIAQTVGGKRIAWLLAILAAFAVMATLGTQWNKSQAALPATTITLAQSPAGGGSVSPGQTVTYTVNLSTTGVNTNGAVVISVVLPAGLQTATSTGTCPAAAVGGAGITWALGGAGTGTITCTSSAVLTAAIPAGNHMTASAAAAASGTVAANPSASIRDADNTPIAATLGASVGALTITGVSGSGPGTVLVGTNATFTLTIPIGLTYCSDVDGVAARTFANTDVVVSNGTLVTATPTLNPSTATDTLTVVVTPTGTPVGVSVRTHLDTSVVTNDCTTSTAITAAVVNAELRHIPDGVGGTTAPGTNTGTVVPAQEFNWNVRGSRHTVCAVQENTGIDDSDADTLQEAPAVPMLLPGLTLANIVITNGGGYTSTADTDPTITDLRIFVGDGTQLGTNTTSGLLGATCFSWVSTDAGDQQINLVWVGADLQNYNASWDTDGDGNGQAIQVNRSLVKEWNRLEDSEVTAGTLTGVGNSTTVPVLTRTLGLTLNSATGLYTGSTVSISDLFRGSHTNSAGVKEGPHALAGVAWEVDRATGSSACGVLTFPGTVDGVTMLDPSGAVVGGPAFTFTPTGCTPGQVVTIRIRGWEPGPLGSGTGTIVTELVRFEFTAQLAAKQVFLAWAGQRVILEHDWRIPAGDTDGNAVDGPIPLGECPFGEAQTDGRGFRFPVDYVKGSGPGNFLPSLGAQINGSDHARVWVEIDDSQSFTDDDDIVGDANGSCISRVLFESEDQGQVDIEAFVPDYEVFAQTQDQQIDAQVANVTKHAFVIYYMKLNTVTTSLATQFSKPTHNGSVLADWANTTSLTTAPTNPWDASKDDADNATEWNVSKDLLVRVRVTGWFTNSNPSGRARDDSNPLNVLPADRWVMPNDWALLAGGPADNADGTAAIGTAEQFRPYYDIMTSPSNAAGALTSPDGGGYTFAALVSGTVLTNVAAGNTGVGTVASPVTVNSCTSLTAGRVILFSDQVLAPMTVTSCAAGNLVLTAPRASAPAAGVAIMANLTGVGSALNPIPVSSCAGLVLGTPVVIGITPVGIAASCTSGLLVVSAPLAAAPAIGTPVLAPSGVPFEGPFSLLDIVGLAPLFGGAALSNSDPGNIRDTAVRDGDVNMWDAPMPPAMVSVAIRGTGFIKQVLKQDVYYLGTPNTLPVASAGTQTYPNPFYITNIPDSPFIPAVVVGGGYLWDSWGADGPGGLGDGPYFFWQAVRVGTNSAGIGETLSAAQSAELTYIRGAYGDTSIARDLVVYTDNHGEAMVAANGDFRTVLTACQVNTLASGNHCAPGDKVGTGTITATADYPDFRGKHFPVLSNAATVDWTWGGYKDVTIEAGETDQYKYIVFHGLDRDGFCRVPTGAVSLHPVLSGAANDAWGTNPAETIDFLIDSGEGIIIGQSGGGTINDGKQFGTGVLTYSWAVNNPAVSGIVEFPLSPLAAEGATDECQAWIKVSNSLLGVLNILTIAHDDEGNNGFDRIVDLTNTHSYSLSFSWSIITWIGADAISVNDAIKGTGDAGKNP